MKYAVTIISPPGFPHSECFREVAETLYFGLKSLGHKSIITDDPLLDGYRHIILGSNLIPGNRISIQPDSILYNLEQIYGNSQWLNPHLIALFRNYEVWDYSKQNAHVLNEYGVEVKHILPIGYVTNLTRIKRTNNPDIDVCFFGSLNERRTKIFDEIRSHGFNVCAIEGIYGAERDQLIARSKLAFNIHFHDAKILEMVRISYFLANRIPVLTEGNVNNFEDEDIVDAVCFADYEQLTENAIALLKDTGRLHELSKNGLKYMRGRKIEDWLKKII